MSRGISVIIMFVIFIFLVNIPRCFMLTYYFEKYLSTYEYESFSPMGLQMCISECQQRSYCKSVNFVRQDLKCELKKNIITSINSLIDKTGSIVVSMDLTSNSNSTSIGQCMSSCGHEYSQCVEVPRHQYTCFRLFIGCHLPKVDIKNVVGTPDPGYITVGQTYQYQCVTGYHARGQGQTCIQANTLTPSSPDVTCYKTYTFSGDSTTWILVFRVQSEVGVNNYDTWHSSGTAHETDKSVGDECVSTVKNNSCTHIYRTSIIDDWGSTSISKAKLAIYSNFLGLVRFVTFNASGTTYTTWFQGSRILSSSWTDMTSAESYNTFTIAGGNSNRNFEITDYYNTCPNDKGWFLVTAQSGPCSYDNYGLYPQILYCSSLTSCLYVSGLDQADVYMVLIDANALN